MVVIKELITKQMNSLFKGYLPTSNKKAIIPFKDKDSDELMTIDEVKNLPEFAGVLADDVIMVDMDDYEQSEVMMNIVEDMQLNCAVYQTTRGKHFLFRNRTISGNGTDKSLAIGLVADIKVGSKNSYSVLKFGGVDRHVEWDIEEEMEYQVIPKWMHPINTKVDFFNMKAGSRNQSLYNYILTLQSNDFTEAEIKEVIRIINKYVIKDPVTDRELETILRDESFKKESFFKGTRFLHDKFATYLKNTHHIKKINGQLHIFNDGVYVSGYNKIEKIMIKEIPSLTDAKRREVLKYLLIDSDNVTKANPKFIAFNNGILDIESGQLNPFSSEIIVTNKIPWNYNPNAYEELMDQTLNKVACNDPEIRMLLEEMFGSVFYASNLLGGGKAFIFTGSGSNGKSTILNLVKHMLGKENHSSLDMKKLNDRFSTVMLFGKLANIGDDLSDEYNSDTSVFKKIVTGETIDAEQKGEPKFEFDPYCKLIFSANDLPHMKDPTGAAQRRLLLVPFNARFKEDEQDFDPRIFERLKSDSSIEFCIKLGVEGLKRVLENKRYTSSKRVQKELDDFKIENNPILSFIDQIGIVEIENEATGNIYKRYQVYCAENHFMPVSAPKFSKAVNNALNFEIGFAKDNNGKTIRIFKSKA